MFKTQRRIFSSSLSSVYLGEKPTIEMLGNGLLLLLLLQCANGNNRRHAVLFSCDFGTVISETYCGVIQDIGDNFDWKLASSSGKSDTGPHQDHTGNPGGSGRFLWTDSNDGSPSQMASISTPSFNLTNDQGWLTFWYHLYGDGLLKISVCQGEKPVLELHGDGRNEWQEQTITVSCGNNPVQVTFLSTLSSAMSDVGVDDVYIYDLYTTTTVIPDTTVAAGISSTTDEITTISVNNPTMLDASTITGMPKESSTSDQQRRQTGPNIALPISLSVVAIFLIAALMMVVCFILKRRQQPEKRTSQNSVYKYDNHAYSTGVDEVRGNTTDTRRNTNDTFDSSTWRSEASVENDTRANGTLGGSQALNRTSQASGGSGSSVPEDGKEEASRHYFVLNPERASMLVENGQGPEVTNGYDPVALYDNKPERYTYIDTEDSTTSMATGNAAGEVGLDANGYDPVTVKDDITGGYQFIDDTGTSVKDKTKNQPDPQSLYEPVSIGQKSSNKSKASDRKVPIPATRKNIPPKPKERMIENILYKPMDGDQMVDNILYKPIQEDK